MTIFSSIPAEARVASNELAFAIRDAYPVTDGHTLVIPYREIVTWWDTTPEERAAIFELVDDVRSALTESHCPDGFNVGFNAGRAAGQTVDHLHIHVIPRYDGDMPDPTGGVRHVIPSRGNYLTPVDSDFHPTRDGRFYRELSRLLRDDSHSRFDLVVAFVMASGVRLIEPHLIEALDRGVEIRILTTDYLLVSDPGALGNLLDISMVADRPGRLSTKVFCGGTTSFHPKAYIFSNDRVGTALVGSSNLSASGLRGGVEWNLRSESIEPLLVEFDSLWNDDRSIDLDQEWLRDYAERKAAVPTLMNDGGRPILRDAEGEEADERVEPSVIQTEALAALESTRHDGFAAGLVVMATGLGKTWLAAFDSSRPSFRRTLFVAHREEILEQARKVFRRVRPTARPSMFVGGERDATGDVVFASVQSLSLHLDEFDPADFDHIIVDEFHHAAATTYRRVIAHFTPRFLLGLTATPNRSDNADLLALCSDNLVYDCDLLRGIELGLLSPFRYRAIKDIADYAEIPWRNGRFDIEELTQRLETRARAEQVFDEWMALGGSDRRAIAFCCSISHAEFMAEFFRSKGVEAVAVHSGPRSAPRTTALDGLRDGSIPIVFPVDLFSEGIDVPEVDLVLMLRPTESPIVFLQQLGRGLRIRSGKSHLDALDLVGNHRSFLAKARMLAALSGRTATTDRRAVELLRNALDDLPEGCSIAIETEAVELLESMLGTERRVDLYEQIIRDWMAEHEGIRPTAMEMSLLLNKPLETRDSEGWFGFLESIGVLDSDEREARQTIGEFLVEVEKGSYNKSYKLVTLKKLLEIGGLDSPASVRELARLCRWEILSDPRLAADLRDASSTFNDRWSPTDEEWFTYWLRNPLAAWTNDRANGRRWFDLESDVFRFAVTVPKEERATAEAMVHEVVEYRLHRYLQQRRAVDLGDRRHPLDAAGVELNATFRVDSVRNSRATIAIESAGGGGRNTDYVAGVDLVLTRLRELGVVIVDCLVESTKVRNLPIPDRRINCPEFPFPISLTEIDDVSAIRKAFLREMVKVGRDRGAKKGGNPRKAMALVVSDLAGDWPNARLADHLAGIDTKIRTGSESVS